MGIHWAGRQARYLSLTASREVQGAAAYFDHLRMSIPSPGPVASCPADFGEVRFAFYRHRDTPALATAQVSVGGCGAASVRQPGAPRLLLEQGPRGLAALERELHVRLTP